MKREIVCELNKHSVANSTGISYNRLRKYAAGIIRSLTNEEYHLIALYLLQLSKDIEGQEN